jgi:hypothetical protein
MPTRIRMSEPRTWADAELFARDYYAEREYHRTFNALGLDEQLLVILRVQAITAAIELYMEGYAEPLSDWSRAQVQYGAATARRIEPVTEVA